MKQRYSIVQLSETNKPKTQIYTSKDCVTLGRALNNDLRVQQNGIENKHLEMNLKNKTLLAYGSDVKINDFPVSTNTITSFNFNDKISIKDTHFSVQIDETNDDGVGDKSTLSNLVDTPFFSPSPLKFNPSPQKPRRSVEPHPSVLTPSYDQSTTTSDYNLYLQPPVRNVKQTSSDFLDVSQPKLNHEESFLAQTEDGLSSEIKNDLNKEIGILESPVERMVDGLSSEIKNDLNKEIGILESPLEKTVDEFLEKKEIILENIPTKSEILDSNLDSKNEKNVSKIPGIFSKSDELNILNNAINEENSDGIVTIKRETVTETINNGTKEVTKEVIEEIVETETKTFFGLEEAIDREAKRVDEEIKSNVEKITEGSVNIPVSPEMVKHPHIDLHAAVLEKNILKNAKDVLEEEVRDKVEIERSLKDRESMESNKIFQLQPSIEILESESLEGSNLITKRLSDGDEKIPDLRIKRIKKEEGDEILEEDDSKITKDIITEPIIEEIPMKNDVEEVEKELEYKEEGPKSTLEVFEEKEGELKNKSEESEQEKNKIETQESNVEKPEVKRKRGRKPKERKPEDEVIKVKGKRGRKPKNKEEKKIEEEGVIKTKGKRGRKPKNHNKVENKEENKEGEIIKKKGKRGRKPKGEKKAENLDDKKIENEGKSTENNIPNLEEILKKKDISIENAISPRKRGRPSHKKDSSGEKHKESEKNEESKFKKEETKDKNFYELEEKKYSSKESEGNDLIKEKEQRKSSKNNSKESEEKDLIKEKEQRKSSKNNSKESEEKDFIKEKEQRKSSKNDKSSKKNRHGKHKSSKEEETSKSKTSSTESSSLTRKPRRSSFNSSTETNKNIKKSEVNKLNSKKYEKSDKKQQRETSSEDKNKIKKKRKSAAVSNTPTSSSKKSKK
ncbi:hypothetical protein CWI38_0392p0030 [Hamiltosporidium tvaerminnensis]|uniref:FHA domain-containing protein n=2 Tax=Hamiltosporidium TaxID=1176354 RepID=A0A4Q9M0L9_9MICR|nr:hypothetical protein CWI38_0392p0030 [Hamiltosporidium tvaerminnensis]